MSRALIVTAIVGVLLPLACKGSRAPTSRPAPADTAVGSPSERQTEADVSERDVELGASADRKLCQDVCAFTADAPCADRAVDCVGTCVTSLADPACGAFTRALVACKFAAGPTAFTCQGGVVVFTPGLCQSEFEQRQACNRKDALPD